MVGATAATLIIGAELWERTDAPGVRKQVLLFNIATVVTVVIGVSVLYAALYLLALVAAFWFVVPQVFTQQRRPSGLSPRLLRIGLVDLLFGDDWGRLGCGPRN